MHGRPRKPRKPEDAKASAAKASNLRSLQSQLLHHHHNSIYSKEALDVSAKILEINPEWLTAWNYRKLAVEHNLKHSESDPDSVKSVLDLELRVVESALRNNFKSYGAWHHRKWVLNKGHSSMERELRLLDHLQKADSRNFHAWNYRRSVAALKNLTDEEELKFTTDMINTNFSNYSAWHNRSVILSHLLKKGADGFSPKEKVLTDEYELVHQALFTDPDDQSGWFYHLWLLDQTVKTEAPMLISSWPAHGFNVILSVNRLLDGCALPPFATFYPSSGKFPLIIYFTEAVEGVNSSTVTVESVFNTSKDLIWRPLSTLSSGTAQAWVTELNLPDQFSKAFPVEVSVGCSQGITSLSGFPLSCPFRVAFTASVQHADTNLTETCDSEVISWRDENFRVHDKEWQEAGMVVSLDHLKINEDHEAAASKWRAETIAKETALFRELLSEIDCKIGKLSLARLLMARDVMMSFNTIPVSNKEGHLEEVLQLFNDLMQLDPPHSQYYKDERSLVLLRQITSSRESLLRHCSQYRDLTSSFIGSFTCIRLKALSLSRIGSVEQFLWVQMLDLSHNELQSIEGLEAMQLLSRLNLSYNKISSLMALAPLKLLKSLEVLDVSFNEIGMHSIDSARYLCSSPLCHTLGSEWSFEGDEISGVEVSNYWEALLIIKGLNLTQLDIGGNAITSENFKLLLAAILPKLKWLDGKMVR